MTARTRSTVGTSGSPTPDHGLMGSVVALPEKREQVVEQWAESPPGAAESHVHVSAWNPGSAACDPTAC